MNGDVDCEEPSHGERGPPGGLDRLWAVGSYLGLAPLCPARFLRRPFVRHHRSRGAVATLLLALLFGLGLLGLGVITHVLRSPDSSPARREGIGGVVLWSLLACAVPCLIVWSVGGAWALAGSVRERTPLGPLARRPWILRLALVVDASFWLAALLVALAIPYADSITRDDLAPAPAWVLVDKRGAETLIPHAVVKLACVPLARAVNRRWGEGSLVVTPLNEASLRAALRHGTLVVVWSHGSLGAVAMSDGWASAGAPFFQPGPSDPRTIYVTAGKRVEPIERGDALRILYLSACHGGSAGRRWAECVAPAEVITFDRLSGGLEHLMWLWFEAPRRVREGV